MCGLFLCAKKPDLHSFEGKFDDTYISTVRQSLEKVQLN